MSDDEVTEIVNALKPPRCPKCGEEIDHLHYYAYELNKADFWKTREYSNWDTLGDIKGDPDYDCPECGETLFHDQKDAEKFLRGEADGN